MEIYSPLEVAIIEAANKDDMYRIRSYKRAWSAYYGRYGDSLRVKPGTANDNIKLGFCRTIVDYGAAFLFGKDLKFTIEDTDQENFAEVPVPKDQQTLWLSKLWRYNQQQILLTKLAINGAICGHSFLKIVPGTPFPRLTVLDPSIVSVKTNPDDYTQIDGYRIQYNTRDPRTDRPAIARQLMTPNPDRQSWRIRDQINPLGSSVYTVDGSPSAAVSNNWVTLSDVEWPYSWPPIIDCQNLPAPNQYYGTPDLTEDIIHITECLNMVMSNRNKVVRLKGHPITWARGLSAQQLDVSPDNTLVIQSPDGVLDNLEMKSDMAPAKQLYDDLMEAFFIQTHMPPIALGQMETFGNTSGLALQILYGPLVERTQYKRRLYGYLLEELNSRLLEMEFDVHQLSTVVHWPDILPVDPLAQGQSLQIDQTFGASNDTLLTIRGYDGALELSKRKQEISDGTAQPMVSQPSLARGEGLPGDFRTAKNQAETPNTPARKRADRQKSEGKNN